MHEDSPTKPAGAASAPEPERVGSGSGVDGDVDPGADEADTLRGQGPQILVLSATLFVAMVGFGVVIPALGDLALRFGASSIEMGAMTAAYALAQLLFAPLWGALCDRVGRKPVLVLGLFGFSLSFLLMGLAESFGGLMAGRVLGGLLSASALPTAQAFAADLAGPRDRAVVMGRLGAAMASGFVLGPVLSALLLPFGARAPFAFSLVLSLLTALAALVFLREPRRSPTTAANVAAGGGAWRVLVYAAASPAAVWFWSAFVIMFGASSVFALLVFFVEEHLGGTALDASIAFACFGGASALVQGVLLRQLTSRLGERNTVRLALLVGCVGFTGFALAASVPHVYVATTFVGAGMALARPCLSALASTETTLGQGLTMGVQSAFDALGRVLGPLGAGLTYQLTPWAPFACAAGVYLIGLALVSATRRPGRSEPPVPG